MNMSNEETLSLSKLILNDGNVTQITFNEAWTSQSNIMKFEECLSLSHDISLLFNKETPPESLTARDYQESIVSYIWQQTDNYGCIVSLETGLGKTFIALLFICKKLGISYEKAKSIKKRHFNRSDKMIKKHSETRLRSKIIFLVPTKNLLDQQTQYFEDHLPHYFSVYSIKSATEYAYGKKLFQKEERPIFIVMIHKVCLTLLRGGNMDISEIDHLIFDECHHAQKEHPYNLIMREFYFYNINFRADEKEWYADRPYILGLTASPIKTKIKDSSMYELGFEMKEQLKELCTNLNSKIVTIDFDKLEESLKRNLNTDFITFEMFAYLKKIHDPKNSINKTPDLIEVIQKNIESLSEEDRNIILNFSDILL